MSENKREKSILVMNQYAVCADILRISQELFEAVIALCHFDKKNGKTCCFSKGFVKTLKRILSATNKKAYRRMELLVSELRIDTDSANSDNLPDRSSAQCGGEHGHDDDDVADSDDILCDDCAYCPDFDDDVENDGDDDCVCDCDCGEQNMSIDQVVALLNKLKKLQNELGDDDPFCDSENK